MIKKALYALILAAIVTAGSYAMHQRGWLERVEFTTWNWRVQVRAAPGVATEDIKLIMVDEESLQWAAEELRIPWPWPREIYSAILQFASRGGARAVAFDVLFLDHSLRAAEDDQLLGEAIRNGPPFAAAVFLGDPGGQFTEWPSHVPDHALRVRGFDQWAEGRALREMVMERAAFPIPDVATNAVIMGDVKGVPDPDSIIRRVHLFRQFDGRAIPALGLSAYMAAQSPDRRRLPELRMEEGSIRVGRRRIPIDEEGRSILRYRGPPGTHQRFQAGQIIRDEIRIQNGERPLISPIEFNNKYVLLGFSAPGLLDLRPTPISNVTPGVEVHATMLDNFLSNDFVRLLPDRWALISTFILALLATFSALLSNKAWRSAVVFVAFLPLPGLIGFYLYAFSIWWPIVLQSLAISLGLVGGVLVNYALEGRQKAFIKGAFKHYLSPAVIEQIMRDPDQLKLGGERRNLTIFFSDLAGFSALSEKLEPQALTQLLNDYLSDMTDIVLAEGGTLDKYEGDAIIAFWNAPLDQPDHAVRAVRTALRCQRKLAERRDEFKQRTGVELHMRIGVNTGDVVVGNMGSRERFDYTVLGDAANLASRLEGANKFFGTSTMIAESTWSALNGELIGRLIGSITVVGRKTPVKVYEVLGFAGESLTVPVESFEQAIELCLQGDWKSALAEFSQWTDDPLAQRYAKKCQALLNAPSETWDGIWNLTEK